MEGIDAARVTSWFQANVTGVVPPLDFGGATDGQDTRIVQVSDGSGHRWALCRALPGPAAPGRGDVAREHRVLVALGPTAVPTATPVGQCLDASVTGGAFAVREWVDGHVVASAEDATQLLAEDGRLAAGLSLIDALAALHAVDVPAAGLDDLGPGRGYAAAQLERWHRQVVDGQDAAGRCLLLVEDLHRYLAATLPPEPTVPSLLHGDFRLDNAVVGDDGQVQAILDWQAATLGDPMVDLGQLLVYWTDPGQENDAMGASTTAVAGFPSRRALVERYAERSGRDVEHLDFYVGLAYWKLACILEGIYAHERYGGRADASYLEALSHQAVRLAESAREMLGGP